MKRRPAATPGEPDRRSLGPLTDELARAVEDLLLGGLTAASPATLDLLEVSFREASRRGLLRLGSTLKNVNLEIARYTRDPAEFSARRFLFFLGRAWLLARGMARALAAGDEAGLARLAGVPPPARPVPDLEVVTLGVAKKVVAGSFCAFDFRLRVTRGPAFAPRGTRLVWSCVFPLRSGAEFPPEGYLHLEQKQKFKPVLFLERRAVRLTGAAVAPDAAGPGRLLLGEGASAASGPEFRDWEEFLAWDREAALARVRSHAPGPLDLEVELQEEVALPAWEMGEEREGGRPDRRAFPVAAGGVEWEAVVSRGPEGQPLGERLPKLAAGQERPALFGLAHYESCRIVLQPLSAFGGGEGGGPDYLTISDEKVSQRELLRALDLARRQ